MANLENNSISGEMPAPNLTDLSGTGAFRNSMIGAGTSGSLASLQAGHVLGGRFAILKQIGMGGMGAVYQAHDRNRGDDIAIKVMLPELVSSDIAKQRFVNEAKVAIKLAHQNIVNTYDVLTDGAYLFITMELLEGRSLRQDLEARKRANRPYTEAEALEITYALCDALEYAHDYTVHRDIKPENIWITSKGRVKLMDFGLARMLNGSQMSQTTSGLGTAYYVAPEQLAGSKELDGRADQYSLGIMLYELLAGQVPAGRAQSVRQLRNDVSAVVSDAIDRALSSNLQDRYPNMRTFADVLRGTNQSAGQASPKVIELNRTSPTGTTAPGVKDWINQHRKLVGFGVFLWCGVLISSFLVYQHSQKQNQLNWEKWQTKMARMFKQTEELAVGPGARIQAWEKYLSTYAKNNPFSDEDENLRLMAEEHLQKAEAEKQEAVRVAQQQKESRQRMQAQAAQQQQQASLQQQQLALQQQQAAQAQQSQMANQLANSLLQRALR